jgi:hypothetical protein
MSPSVEMKSCREKCSRGVLLCASASLSAAMIYGHLNPSSHYYNPTLLQLDPGQAEASASAPAVRLPGRSHL